MALFQQFHQQKDRIIELVQDQTSQAGQAQSFITLIIGLGNIGKEYEETRHNIGFAAVDEYRKLHKFPPWQDKAKFKALLSEDFINGQKVILAKPTTLMNLSGVAVRALKDFYKLSNADIVVIHDELDLPLGTVKQKQGGGSAGHNGLKSLISHIGEDFKRIRVGIKTDQLSQKDAADFVLARFGAAEKKQLAQVLHSLQEMLE